MLAPYTANSTSARRRAAARCVRAQVVPVEDDPGKDSVEPFPALLTAAVKRLGTEVHPGPAGGGGWHSAARRMDERA